MTQGLPEPSTVLALDIQGPAFSARLLARAGEPEAVLGRDPACRVCIPDPHRNVSRRHLAVRNGGGRLQFRVLSTVNGVLTAAGEVLPGGAGVLLPGEALQIGEYVVRVQVAAHGEIDGGVGDPWTELETQSAALEQVGASAQDDPFDDWFARRTFGPGVPRFPVDRAAAAPAKDLHPFLQGLGLDPAAASLSESDLRNAGVVVRQLVAAVLRQRKAAQPAAAVPSVDTALQALFTGLPAAAGAPVPGQVLRELLGEPGPSGPNGSAV